MELISELASSYCETFTSPEDALLKKIREETFAGHDDPHMLSGHLQGKFLQFISKLMAPKYILEIGTFTGYSAICLAAGLREDGVLHTIDISEKDGALSSGYFKESKYAKKIHLHVGNAADIIPALPYKWDLVFIDADKTGYITYYEQVVPRLSENGLIIADNVLFHGQVLQDPVKGKNALAIDRFNKHVAADGRTEQVMLTVRDGLLLIKNK